MSFDKNGSLSDLGFSAEDISALKEHTKTLGNDSQGFGYSSDTEQHFKETGNPTSAGSIQGKMRKVGEHLGYKHWGTANPERIKDYIKSQQAPAAAPEAEEVDTSKPASQKLSKAQAYTQAYGDFRRSGGAVDQMAGDLGARDEFMNNYKLNLQRRMEPGVANAVGNDDLPPMEGAPDMDKKRSKIAADIVGKKAGFGQV